MHITLVKMMSFKISHGSELFNCVRLLGCGADSEIESMQKNCANRMFKS